MFFYKILLFFNFINLSFEFLLSNNFLKDNWHCIGIKENIDFSKPYKINIGELPLVIWKNPINKELISAVNICKHMGSKLDNGEITRNGCLKCQYHGLEYSDEDKFGKIIEHEGKIFWSYEPKNNKPFSVPFYNNKEYIQSFLEIDMESSLKDSAYNTMDLRHPEYVHNKIVGFGNNIPPQNIKYYKYNDSNRIGLSFNYFSNKVIRKMNKDTLITKNFHMYIYPSFSWSKVTFNKNNKNNDLIIGVDLLPLNNDKTRWYITICHNYYKSDFEKNLMKVLAFTILSQDFIQMKNQYKNNNLKNSILFEHVFKDEEVILELHKMFDNYKYPDIEECVKLYTDYKLSKKKL